MTSVLYCVACSALKVIFQRYALHKSAFYLLTYLFIVCVWLSRRRGSYVVLVHRVSSEVVLGPPRSALPASYRDLAVLLDHPAGRLRQLPCPATIPQSSETSLHQRDPAVRDTVHCMTALPVWCCLNHSSQCLYSRLTLLVIGSCCMYRH